MQTTPLAARQFSFERDDTNQKRKRGNRLRPSLALRASVNPGCEWYICSSVAIAAVVALCFLGTSRADDNRADAASEFKMSPIGRVQKSEGHTFIVLGKKYRPGLLGLDGFSHIYMLWWFDRNDTPQRRATLQVHPMGNRQNPLTGVFATRSPARPNLIALTLCKIVAVKDDGVEIEKTDAFDGTPVLDIKPFIPGYDSATDAKLPDWLVRSRKHGQ